MRTRTRLFHAAVLLPSCVQWNIGANIREGTETQIGADCRIRHKLPPELAAKHKPSGLSRVYLAPEIRYRVDTPIVTTNPHVILSRSKAYEHQPTGRLRLVTVHIDENQQYKGIKIGEAVAASGSGLSLIPRDEGKPSSYPSDLGSAKVEHGTWYPLAAIAAAPFDCAIAPLLSAICTPFFCLVYVLSFSP